MNVLIPPTFVPGIPKGQPRPRAFAHNGKARVFDPGTAEGWKNSIAVALGPALCNRPPATVPVLVRCVFLFPRPKAHYTKKGLRENAPRFHAGKPDTDNLLKAVMDALTTLGVWQDDAQVAWVECSKQYADKPGALIEVAAAGVGE